MASATRKQLREDGFFGGNHGGVAEEKEDEQGLEAPHDPDPCKKRVSAPAGVAQWIERRPVN